MREIDVIKDMLTASAAIHDPALGWGPLRQQGEAFGAAQVLPDDWSEAPVEGLGAPAVLFTGAGADASRAILYFHGGGYVIGSATSHRGLAARLGADAQTSVYALEYRLAPEHPAPAAIEDAETAYAALLARGLQPERIALAGDSAGAGLAVALTQRLIAQGRPTPGALFLMSPWVDLTLSGRSMTFRASSDPMLSAELLTRFAAAYRPEGGLDDALASPLFGSLEGFPDTLIQVGTDEVLLSDAERLQEGIAKTGAFASLEVWPGMVHVFQLFHPMLSPGREALEDAGAWLKRRLS